MGSPAAPHIDVAFKEWASVVLALEQGKQDVIFRKGGIAEEGRGFTVDHGRFFLFPTYFHQQRAGLRDERASLFDQAMHARPPDGRIVITSRVSVKRTFVITEPAEIDALAPRHVYAPHVLVERLQGRHGTALHVLEVDVHLLDAPLDLPLLERYAGCRSWVDLEL
jgi:hypothetical protein